MYIVPVKVGKSSIEGEGVFASADIPKGQIVWQFTEGHDMRITVEEFEGLSESQQEEMRRVGYLSPSTKQFVYPPQNDPARYTNHSRDNNTTVAYDKKISDEPYFVANREIKAGEEVMNNYLEFDEFTQQSRPDWL